jgi:ABC-type dipeptide/oligopeptide/nickel transport system permease component
MFNYIVRRILQSIPILLVVLTLVFVFVRVLPGDPAVAALGDYASKEAVQALREKLGLDAPLWVQYFRFISNLLRGDLGSSLITGYPVAKQISNDLPYTLELTFCAILFGYVFGIPLGLSAAVKRNSFIDYFNRIFSLLGLSIPAFYLGVLGRAVDVRLFNQVHAVSSGGRRRFIRSPGQLAPPLSPGAYPWSDYDGLHHPYVQILVTGDLRAGLRAHGALQGYYRPAGPL